MQALKIINFIISVLFTACYSYQLFYLLVPFIKKPKAHTKTKLHEFAVLICARNEALVIANLIESIRQQTYPTEMISIFVAADNCTDNTAEIARRAGAAVFERFDNVRVGKGYALNFLLKSVKKSCGNKFDGYIVFDADNVLDPKFIENMNKTFSDGFDVVTGYRNSKNYSANWISAGYGLWFLRDSKFLNDARMRLGLNCSVTGTGFLFSRRVIENFDGWNFFSLIEDTEFTARCTVEGIRIGYCADAVFYDEQPVKFSQSWRQRMRWTRGYFRVLGLYGKKLFGNMFRGGFRQRFSNFDITMYICPALFLSIIGQLVNIGFIFAGIIFGRNVLPPLISLLKMLGSGYLTLFVFALVTTLSEWKNIHSSAVKKLLYCFTLPIFMFTYLPITIAALFKDVEWKPIAHTCNVKLGDIIKNRK